jgi:hypothetical protein
MQWRDTAPSSYSRSRKFRLRPIPNVVGRSEHSRHMFGPELVQPSKPQSMPKSPKLECASEFPSGSMPAHQRISASAHRSRQSLLPQINSHSRERYGSTVGRVIRSRQSAQRHRRVCIATLARHLLVAAQSLLHRLVRNHPPNIGLRKSELLSNFRWCDACLEGGANCILFADCQSYGRQFRRLTFGLRRWRFVATPLLFYRHRN